MKGPAERPLHVASPARRRIICKLCLQIISARRLCLRAKKPENPPVFGLFCTFLEFLAPAFSFTGPELKY